MSEYFSVEVIAPYIICFRLNSFTRVAVDAWADYVKEHDGKLQAPVRILYDMRKAGFPTPYSISTSLNLMQEVAVVDDMRTAYVAANRNESAYYQVLAKRMPRRIGEVRVFLDEPTAIDWLLS